MASIVRPSATMLRQTCLPLANPARNAAFYSTTSAPLAVVPSLRSTQLMKREGINSAGFHQSAKRDILKPLPQVVHGTTNDPAPIPPTSPTHGSYHWTFERIIAASLIPLTVAPFAAGTLNPVMDAVLCGTLVLHSHVGFQSVIIDYLPQKRVPKTWALAKWGLRAATLTVAVGLYEFETNDVGVTEAIKRIWKA